VEELADDVEPLPPTMTVVEPPGVEVFSHDVAPVMLLKPVVLLNS